MAPALPKGITVSFSNTPQAEDDLFGIVADPLGQFSTIFLDVMANDKGGNANLGIFARSDEAWAWLDQFLTVDKLKQLLPEAAELRVERYRLPAIRSLNFVLYGLLEEGVAASTRQDPQAKGLGEWLRARVVDMPEALLPNSSPSRRG